MGWESTSRPSRTAFKRPNIARRWNRQEKQSKQEKPDNVQSILKTVWLLEGPEDVSCDWENSLTEDSILVRAEINLKSDNNLEEIRGELQAVIEKPYPTNDMYDFEFVKREHNVIITPVTMSNIYVETYVRLKAHINEKASGETDDKCQENIAIATTSESSASTSCQVYPNVSLCNTNSATAQELAQADDPHFLLLDPLFMITAIMICWDPHRWNNKG